VRLRLVLPRRRRRAGLGGLTLLRARPPAARILSRGRRAGCILRGAALVAVIALAGCGSSKDQRERPAPTVAAPPAPVALATGLTEANAQLLWTARARPDLPAGLGAWRDRLQALRPRYVRVLVDWAALQPRADAPPDFAAPADGCLRGLPPCGAYAGLREQLQAIASEQREGDGAPQVEMVVLGVPDWAATPAAGCERSDAGPFSRPITRDGLQAYASLLRALVDLGRQTGAQLRWWSPWNEPNHPAFVSPQRARCRATAPSRAADVYAQLVRAARDALDAAPGDQRLILGELAGHTTPTPRGSSVAEVVAGLPDDVACASRVWSQHAYAELEPDPDDEDPIAALERVLDARPCTRGAHIWVTETGAGGRDPGADRPVGDASLRAGCRAQDALLRRWTADPRVDVAIQYTFREDTAYPVGLVDARLSRAYPAYDLWRAWGARDAGAPPPDLPASCR
jgi:hypothetical protein